MGPRGEVAASVAFRGRNKVRGGSHQPEKLRGVREKLQGVRVENTKTLEKKETTVYGHPPPKKNRQEQLSTFWPPKKLPPLPSVWTAVDAFDPARQGRTLETLLDMILLWLLLVLGGWSKGRKNLTVI